MNQIVAMLFPSFIALKVFSYLSQKKLKISDYITYYFIFNVMINLFAYAITIYFFNDSEIIFTNAYTVKYLILSVLASVILPLTLVMVSKRLSIKIISK